MYGNEQVGTDRARPLHARTQIQKTIVAAGQYTTHAGLAVDERDQATADRQRDILFPQTTGSVCARIMATVARHQPRRQLPVPAAQVFP